MPLRLRNHATGTGTADRTLPPWPAKTQRDVRQARQANAPLLVGSLSEQHAARAWADARRHVVLSNPPGEGVACLAFVSAIARHIVSCSRCHQTGRADTQTPAAWLLWAMGKQPATKRIMGPILKDRGIRLPAEPPRRGR